MTKKNDLHQIDDAEIQNLVASDPAYVDVTVDMLANELVVMGHGGLVDHAVSRIQAKVRAERLRDRE